MQMVQPEHTFCHRYGSFAFGLHVTTFPVAAYEHVGASQQIARADAGHAHLALVPAQSVHPS